MKKQLIKSVLTLLAMAFVVSCNAQTRVNSQAYDSLLVHLLEHNVPEVSVKEMTNPSVVYLDAREINEFKVSLIKGATWVGYDDFKMKRVSAIAKNTKIVVYCSVGYRSEKITQKLLAKGYTNVSNLYGGLFEWVNQDKVIVNKQNQPTNKVHAYNKEWGFWLDKGEKVY